jgi:hypothetical protein
MGKIGSTVKPCHFLESKIMDIAFEFLLPRRWYNTKIEFRQKVYEWQGEEFPQGQEEAWFDYFKLVKSDIPEHIIPLLPDYLQKQDWMCISVQDGIEDLLAELSVKSSNAFENTSLMNLVTTLLGSEKRWVVIFEPDYDCINEVLEGVITIVLQKIVDSLNISREGFVIWNGKNIG